MNPDYKPGTYINYPCSECGRKMRLKTDLKKLSGSDEATIECSECKIKKKYTAAELKAMLNAQ
ncbi:hypothetical protein [Halanaerobacter jeridensis]|uniref:DNA-directed RNA polymerase subunit RPC12/RpoP n=1 Tax=Halanaerobacter jeridensis TaxID=706427 RepID=A0A938XTQ0_9FIRM|nr:hypothetical protein [Halanaerobacter jeridensis]MBM7557350.1 DNA-directed RNA polymerase subunit RPC12/RpoP [Halanaerobacter jeridensis]